VKKNLLIASSIISPNIVILYSEFLISQRWTRYRKAIGGWKDTNNEFYSNDYANDDLENEFKKTLGCTLSQLFLSLSQQEVIDRLIFKSNL
jgi:hypothetical protein